MNPNICNNCGGDYEYRHGRWICRACGAYKPEELSNEEVTLLYTAFQKLRLAEFAEAEMEFDDILQKYPQNPNAYWGRLMSKYGIKYEQDFDGRMIPTCYATSIESLLSAQDYLKAIQYADNENRAYYQSQAEYIERVRKEWLEKAKKEKPYDIFICYKDSDLANGIKRTQDSYEAQELYTFLTDLGYHVFYSHITLRDKVGEKYEPYIFNALSTAKVMIVYGSKPEYITSTWLKNEWTRYAKRIKNGEKKPNSLLVAYDGFSPSELPTALSSMQCMNAGDKSFYNNLDNMIERIFYGETMAEKYEKKKKSKAPIVISLLLLLCAIGGFLAWNFLANVDNCEHVVVNISGKEATCTEDGMTEGEYCAACSKILKKQTVIPASHTPGVEATCTTSQYCTVCNAEIKAPLGHTAGAEATCTTAQKCTICSTELKSALGHTPGAGATCTTDQTCTVCNEELKATGHTPEWEIITEATQTENGLKVQKCSVCGVKLAEEIIHAEMLQFTSNGDGTCYVSGIGTYADTDVIIPSMYNGMSVTSIGKSAFSNCKSLTSITIPNSVTSIETSAFSNCTSLTRITVDSSHPNYASIDGVLFNKTMTELIFCPEGKTGAYPIPDSVTDIGEKAFANCSNLTSVVIPNSVTSIGKSAFSNCSGLTSIVVPNSVTSIGISAFFGCGGLTSITLPFVGNKLDGTSNTHFGYIFGASKVDSYHGGFIPLLLKTVVITGGSSIGNSAFYDCDGLTSIVIPDSVTSIGSDAFSWCYGLTSITFNGTTAEWNAISKGSNWKYNTHATKVICSDGTVSLS